jgi:hypothetical protein
MILSLVLLAYGLLSVFVIGYFYIWESRRVDKEYKEKIALINERYKANHD